MNVNELLTIFNGCKAKVWESQTICNIEINGIDYYYDLFSDLITLLSIVKIEDKSSLIASCGDNVLKVASNSDEECFFDYFSELTDIDVRFTIEKTDCTIDCVKYINIYSEKAFIEYLESLSTKELMMLVNECSKNCDFLLFNTCESANVLITNGVAIGGVECIREYQKIKLEKENLVLSQYNVNHKLFITPECFHLIHIDVNKSKLYSKFETIKTLLSMFTIVDSASLENEKIVCNVLGNRLAVEWNYVNKTYFEIYNWIYEGSYYFDKLMICKQILEITRLNQVSENSLRLMVANYNVQQRKHVIEFFNLKKDLSKYMIEASESIFKIEQRIIDRFIQNFMGIVGFIFSIVIINQLSLAKNLNDIFTKDIMIIINFFSLLSFVYLIFTIIVSKNDVDTINRNRRRLIENYQDVFIEETTSLFEKDGYVDSKKRIIKTIRIYSGVWHILLISFVVFLNFSFNKSFAFLVCGVSILATVVLVFCLLEHNKE